MIDSREAVVREIRDKNRLMENETLSEDLSLTEEYILDRTDVKVIFITLYTIVFISCFLGKWSPRFTSIELPCHVIVNADELSSLSHRSNFLSAPRQSYLVSQWKLFWNWNFWIHSFINIRGRSATALKHKAGP